MPPSETHTFFRDLDGKLWFVADRLRANLDAADYKHAVLSFIVLKYASDSFVIRQREIEAQFRAPASDYCLDSADYDSPAAHAETHPRRVGGARQLSKRTSSRPPRSPSGRRCRTAPLLPPGTEIAKRRAMIAARAKSPSFKKRETRRLTIRGK